MNAVDAIQRDSFYWEACRICDELGVGPESLPSIERRVRYRAYQEAIRPHIRLKTKMFSLKMPKYLIHADGRSEAVYEWTEEEKKAIAQIDELMAAEARRCGLTE